MSGAGSRYARRQRIWSERHSHLPLVRHHAWWLLHNVVSHPVLGVAPTRAAVWFHDWTSKHLNQRADIRPSPQPRIPPDRRVAWAWHNIAGHAAIGILPVQAAFDFHDRTADAMGVEDWI